MKTHPTPTTENLEKAQLLYPSIVETPEYFEQLYPKRDLPESALVTRFAPSPTGFVHIGGIFASLISKRLAEQSGGVFYLRIEDTDQKREIEGGIEEIIKTMKNFGVAPTEGVIDVETEKGDYGPYTQSKRKHIYDVYGKWLVEHDYAYPCFCTEEELAEIASDQEKNGIMKKGYYGKWARHRNLTLDEIKQYLDLGKGFVLRVKCPEQPEPTSFTDLIRGEFQLHGNFVDSVLIKSTGLPTYHFAHVVDDHLMRTSLVTRGEEWISTAPLHMQLFEMFGFEKPKYLHFSHIGKKEGNSVRKLSKRKDPEAAMSLYSKLGYPSEAVADYLLNLINPHFEDWRKANPGVPSETFIINPDKIGKTIAIFDQKKLDNFSQDIIATMTATDIYTQTVKWAQAYDPAFAQLLQADEEYSKKILNIEREQVQPRKDFINWSSIQTNIWYFFDQLFSAKPLSAEIKLDKPDIARFFELFSTLLNQSLSKDDWMQACRKAAEQIGFAPDMKTYKANTTAYKGHVGDLMSMLRLALTKETRTPDLYQIVQVMGPERVINRLNSFIG